MNFNNIDNANLTGKSVLLRVDINVPMHAGKITDATRIIRVLPTIRYLSEKKAKIIMLSHFGRPGGKYDPTMSLAPVVDPLQDYLGDEIKVDFCPSCIGEEAKQAANNLLQGNLLLLENLRFHKRETEGDKSFARELSSLGEVFVNDAFSCSHRPHASISGIPEFLPAYAGLSMQKEVDTLTEIFDSPKRPLAAIVGGSKISTKINLLENLAGKVDHLIIGGAMANSFLHAKGYQVGDSLFEADMKNTALDVLAKAKESGCNIILPVDVIIADELKEGEPNKVAEIGDVKEGEKILDAGPDTISLWANAIRESETLIWNGPVGAFETSPFDIATSSLARIVAGETAKGSLKSVAGGGDTIAALNKTGLKDQISYITTAGGAFLQWLEGKELPGVESLKISA